jgi:predicted component of type VI protein secretion system
MGTQLSRAYATRCPQLAKADAASVPHLILRVRRAALRRWHPMKVKGLSRRLRNRLPLAGELLRLGYLRWGHLERQSVASFNNIGADIGIF